MQTYGLAFLSQLETYILWSQSSSHITNIVLKDISYRKSGSISHLSNSNPKIAYKEDKDYHNESANKQNTIIILQIEILVMEELSKSLP